jgi:hypothetical protein
MGILYSITNAIYNNVSRIWNFSGKYLHLKGIHVYWYSSRNLDKEMKAKRLHSACHIGLSTSLEKHGEIRRRIFLEIGHLGDRVGLEIEVGRSS